MTRRDLKALLKTLLEGVSGVKTVYAGMPKKFPQAVLPAIVISTPKADDERVSGAAGIGKRQVTYTARLTLFHIDSRPNSVEGTLAFDDIIDAIENTIRTNPVLVANSDYPHIGIAWLRTNTAEAKEAGKDDGNIFRTATIEFPIVDFVQG